MTDKLVIKAIQKSVINFISDNALTFPFKALGRTFEIPDDQKYLELVHIPNNDVNQYWNNEKIYRGLFRLVLHWPNNDQGVYEPMDIISLIESYFNKTNTLRNDTIALYIYENPNFTGVTESGHEMLFPVSISYHSFNS